MQFEGILLIDKPSGCTSHDVVDVVRRKLQMKQVGHAGTLDPMATGLLVMLVGKATKLSERLMQSSKVYAGTITLGAVTNTQDAEGEVLVKQEVPDFTGEKISEVAQSFLGDQYQTPPMFSAKKINGTPLYKMARKGQEIERPPQFIHVSAFDVHSVALPEVVFEVACSKGTYVRTLAHDFGSRLGCGAHLSALRRLKSGDLDVAKALTLKNFKAMNFGEIADHLIPIYKI
jgi:tRNA pseudouridine55 synthase